MKLRLEWCMFWSDPSNSIIWGWAQGEMGHHFSALYLPPSPSQPQEHAIQENQVFQRDVFS